VSLTKALQFIKLQAGLILCQGYVPGKVTQIEQKIPIYKSAFP